MKQLLTLFIILNFVLITTLGTAEIPPYMQFQGKATDVDDKPLDGEDYTLTFRIYDAESGGNLK